ncbi:mechanosensitive ion channel domain-containing protein [Phycisphaerales bacterium AB-hyl4]|uniref:Mechanosensitive ion channel domain-containing protein n=1 Tax=Natronomicrosphaera hydrolytica TaxID=3242702 RepID=A0ABV4U5U7_9BACT
MRQTLLLPMMLLFLLVVLWLPGGSAVAQADEAGPAGDAVAADASADDASSGWPEPPAPSPRPDAARMALDLSSPRATLLRTYFPAINRINREEGDLDEAWRHVLATMQWQDVMSEEGARLAAKRLLDVFDRLGEIRDDDLPGERDLADVDINRFIFFPHPVRHVWVWESLERFDRWPDGQIVFVRTNAGWQFSAETVAGIEALAQSMAPLPPRHLAPQVHATEQFMNVLGPTFHQTPYWGWLVLLGGIFAGLVAGKLVSAALRRAGDRLEQRGWPARALLFQDVASPASLALFGLGLAMGLEALVLTEELTELRGQVFQFLYLFALGWFLFNLVNIIEVALRRATERTSGMLDDIVVTLIRRALRIFLVVMFALVVAENVFDLNVTAWIAGFGIVGLGISLAAQDSIRNLFGSITVLLDKPFKVGDFITFDGQSGGVESIGFRSTRMRLLTGHLLTIPNARFIDSNVENITARPAIRRHMNISITYDTPTEKLEEAVQIVKDILNSEEVVEEGRFDMEKSPPRAAFDALNADNLNITALYWYQIAGDPDRGFFTYINHCQLVNIKLITAFREAGIDFAFPTQTLYLAGDQDRELSVRMLRDDPSSNGASTEPQPRPS